MYRDPYLLHDYSTIVLTYSDAPKHRWCCVPTKFQMHGMYMLILMHPSPSGKAGTYSPFLCSALVGMVGLMGYDSID
jgi:hypothetical protein